MVAGRARINLTLRALTSGDALVRGCLTRLLGEFAAIDAVVGHPPRRESIACDTQRELWVAGAFLDAMWLEIVDRDDMNFAGSDPPGPPAVAGTVAADLGAMHGLDDHGGHANYGRGHASMN
jgi:hypothetical protein